MGMGPDSTEAQLVGIKVYTGGTFDIPHRGHAKFLQYCADLGEVTIALNTDEFIAAYKGKPPVMSYEEREAVLREFRSVSDVVPNIGGSDSRWAISLVKPDLVVIGSDWARKDYYKQMGFTQDWLDERGIGLVYLPYTRGISTTDIKLRLAVR
jgi:cytidyltransferase-like protein